MSRKGFTLIELSIVLVIIGLIVGGVLVGRGLIQASYNRSVMTDFERIQTAVFTFRNKYNGLPGDMRTATNFWSTATNGNGNGKIGDNAVDFSETFNAIQQLGFAGLLEGTYTGVSGPLGGGDAIPGTNAVASKIRGAGFAFRYIDSATLSGALGTQAFANHVSSDYNSIVFAQQHDATYYAGWLLFRPAIRSIDAFNIDAKMDEGRPGQGHLLAWCPGLTPGCATSCNDSTAIYDVSNDNITCSFVFKNRF